LIHFFRKIRQRLLSENKLGKYLTYAIGEILLVVIGILIALQINNWNENRKLQSTKQIYLKQLLADFETDKDYAKSTIISLDSSIAKYNNYNKIFKEPNLPFESILIKIGDNSFTTLDLEFKTSTIKSLINTGDIRLFDPLLAQTLANYDGIKSQTLKHSDLNYDNARNILESAGMEGGTSLGLERFNNQPELARVTKIENRLPNVFLKLEAYLNIKNFGDVQAVQQLSHLIKVADSTIVLIEEELKK
jgi:hypothetical protein